MHNFFSNLQKKYRWNKEAELRLTGHFMHHSIVLIGLDSGKIVFAKMCSLSQTTTVQIQSCAALN